MNKLFGFASDADGMCTDMERIENLIRLYFEHTESECDSLNPEKPYTAQVFLNRLTMGTSLLEVIEAEVKAVSKSLVKLTDEMYKEAKLEKQRQT